jgi:polysaccharide pyruvyl transferase CsaB
MRILICGYYGLGNAGDEAILAGAVGALRQRLPEAELVVLSADPPATRKALGIVAEQRWRYLTIWREIGRADLVLEGGGGLIQDSTSAKSALYYLGILGAARLRRRRFVVFAQGIGPLRSRLTRALTGRVLRRAAAITVRDHNSAGLLVEVGVPAEAIAVTADLAALVDPVPNEDVAHHLPPRQSGPLVGLALREVRGAEAALESAMRAARHLRDEHGAQIVPLALHVKDDAQLASQAADLLGTPAVGVGAELSPAEWVGVVRSLDFVIAMRLHACLFAAAQCVPFVALSYDPKVAAFASRAGALWAPLEAELPEVLQLVDAAWTQRDTRASDRATIADDLRAQAERNIDIVETLLRDGPRAARS